jgi:hypothetical protein
MLLLVPLPTYFAEISIPQSECAWGLIGGFNSFPPRAATSICKSCLFTRTRGTGTRFVLRGGELAGDSVREGMLDAVGEEEKSVTVLLSSDSWRVWQTVRDPEVEGREVPTCPYW